MKIEENLYTPGTRFEFVPVGDVFRYEGSRFLKVDGGIGLNAFDFEQYRMVCFNHNTSVCHIPTAKLVIE